jgi:hypothetical protein
VGSVLLTLLLCCTPVRVAWGEERGSSTATASRKYAEAELQPAWELNPMFDVAYNLGKTEYTLKERREAAAPGATVGGPVVEQPSAGPVEPPPRLQERSWGPVIALGAASAVWLGVGIGMTVASNSANSDARAQRGQIFAAGGGCLASPSFAERCAELHRSSERAGLMGDIALGSYIASGVLAAAAVAYALWPATTTEKPTALLVRPEPRGDGIRLVMVSVW